LWLCLQARTIEDVSEVVVVQIRRGRDGKDYPAVMPPSRAWRYKMIKRLHELVHAQGMSHREAQRALLAEGYRRSLGSIAYDLTRPMCEHCRR
jgi:hypothetical protein